jgi:hypothetical protein
LRSPEALRLSWSLPLLLLVAPLATANAQTTDESFALTTGELHASIVVSDPPGERVVASLHEGLESEIQYNVRVYQRTGGLLGILGDKLIGEFQRSYRARWDEFGRDFVISEDGRTVLRTRTASEFLSEFFHLARADTGIRLKPPDSYYVLSNVRIQIVRLVPPLTMISPFLTNREIDTPWVKTEMNGQ